jgi:hypothetical protein
MAGLLAATGCDDSSPTSNPTTPSSASLPSISVAPSSAVAGSTDLKITISGSGFLGERHRKSWAVWQVHNTTQPLSTTFISDTQLIADIPADLMREALSAGIWIETGDPMGDTSAKSSALTIFVILPR